MSDQSLRDDISFLRSLAEAGRDRPVVGGVMLVVAGVIYSTASFLSWAAQTHRVVLPVGDATIWNTSWMLFLAVWLVLFLSMRSRKIAAFDAANRIFGVVWSASGIGILVMIAADALAYSVGHNPAVFAMMPTNIAVLYGAAWFVSSAAARKWWMLAVSVMSFAAALAFALLPDAASLTFAFGVTIILVILLPGIKLMMRAPA